jgi:hypothetical protein
MLKIMRKKSISLVINLLIPVWQHSVGISIKLLIGKNFKIQFWLLIMLLIDMKIQLLASFMVMHMQKNSWFSMMKLINNDLFQWYITFLMYTHIAMIIIIGLYWSINNNLLILQSRLSCIYNRWRLSGKFILDT